ncbi:MAG: hypothetical protein V3U03_13260, partial [Myxococcota bacterium]
DVRWVAHRGPWVRIHSTHTEAGIRFYATSTGLGLTPEAITRAYRNIVSHFELRRVNKVWVLRGAWERALSDSFENYCPKARIDAEADAETHGVLFATYAKDLERCARSRQTPAESRWAPRKRRRGAKRQRR